MSSYTDVAMAIALIYIGVILTFAIFGRKRP